jgi:hypothetical protein
MGSSGLIGEFVGSSAFAGDSGVEESAVSGGRQELSPTRKGTVNPKPI